MKVVGRDIMWSKPETYEGSGDGIEISLGECQFRNIKDSFKVPEEQCDTAETGVAVYLDGIVYYFEDIADLNKLLGDNCDILSVDRENSNRIICDIDIE